MEGSVAEPVATGSWSEADRLALLESYAPDTLEEDDELTAIAAFAAQLCGTPTALVSLVEADRQRFLAREGLDACETPRSQSFCQFAMLMDDVMQVPDATLDPRFADNGLVTGAPFIRFYAGAPLVGDDGIPLGALCVISPEPRPEGLSPVQKQGLIVLASAVMRRFRDRRAFMAKQASEARFRALGDAMPQMAWSTPPDGLTDYFNRRWEEFTGHAAADHYGAGWLSVVHPDDRPVVEAAWRQAVASGEAYEVEYRLRRHDGEWRWTLARGLPTLGEDGQVERWFGTNTDIHETKLLLESRDLVTRELSHRIKNIFTLVSSLLTLESRNNPAFETVAKSVSARIVALGRAHDYVRPGRPGRRGEAAEQQQLVGVLCELFAPYHDGEGARVTIDGDDMGIDAEAITPLALLFHELATNATKYGALSAPAGRVALTISRDGPMTRFHWREEGGPEAVAAPEHEGGFGSTLISMAVERQLRGKLIRHWHPHGLELVAEIPTARLVTR